MLQNDLQQKKTLSSLAKKVEVLEQELVKIHRINPNLYVEYDVKRGLRDSAGKGVLTGLTEVSDVCGYQLIDGRQIPAEGRLYYQGYNIFDLVEGHKDRKDGFEEIIYLLLFGCLPTREKLRTFTDVLHEMQDIPSRFVRDVIMKASNANIMNAMQRCILTLYTYDEKPEDTSPGNALRQSLDLIAKIPMIAIYSYYSYLHFRQDQTLLIRNPHNELSFSENILHMLREDGQFTELEAKVLDIVLMVHAEHGGGNNSTFTTHVVTSTGTDTYSSTAASIGSLKGPKHGGANLKAHEMFKDIKENVKNWEDEAEIEDYLKKILDKQAFDRKGLIYGMGHAVYTLSDPREVILKKFAEKLAVEKGVEEEFALYDRVERIAKELIPAHRQMFKAVCANVDFYSGFVYTMLGIPEELFTPFFAISRMPGWSAHRLEELINNKKIIRPAYKYVGTHQEFAALEER